jgi:hypothetical protein
MTIVVLCAAMSVYSIYLPTRAEAWENRKGKFRTMTRNWTDHAVNPRNKGDSDLIYEYDRTFLHARDVISTETRGVKIIQLKRS